MLHLFFQCHRVRAVLHRVTSSHFEPCLSSPFLYRFVARFTVTFIVPDQKTYTIDFITKKSVKNDGYVKRYYIENNHEAIISRKQYYMVQEELKRRNDKKGIPIWRYAERRKTGTKKCKGSRSIREDMLNQVILEKLQFIINSEIKTLRLYWLCRSGDGPAPDT
jgi:hypothetical protein